MPSLLDVSAGLLASRPRPPSRASRRLVPAAVVSRRRRRVAAVLAAGLLLAGPIGCGGRNPRAPSAVHTVRAGENLYRIGLRYGVPAERIARANDIRDVTTLRIGQRLVIPDAGRSVGPRSRRGRDRDRARRRARRIAHDHAALQFSWPARGRLSSRFGMRRGRPHEGIDIAARTGTPIFASESGRVIHSGRLGSYGKVVIVKHAGRYRSVYAHASRLHVRKGEFVERGQKIAEVGSSGRSTGPHVHFEIRRSETPQNPLGFLP